MQSVREIPRESTRETLKIVVVGHVDHGKSTLIGRLLFDTASLPEGAIAKVKKICKEKGKFFEYAYLLDAFEEEQKQGITIDTTQIQFFTAKRDYIIIDAPGHKEFLKNMISGAANAEAALLIVDAQEGIQEQSKRHGYILSLLGIKKVYVIINKMDLINYSEAEFNRIKDEFDAFLNNLNVFPLKYIPVSAFLGENMTNSSGKMPWYTGEPVLEALDLFHKEKGLEEKPLRFPIQDVYKFDDRRIIAGRIETGKLKVGDRIIISPGNKTTTVQSIEFWVEKDKKEAVQAGLSVGITVSDEFFNKRGEIISHLEEPPAATNLFRANLFWMGKTELVKNKKYKLKLTTQETECEVYSINRVIDASSLETIETAERVGTNDVAEVVIRTKQVVCFDPFGDNQSTGRFVLVDGYDVSGGGIISGALEHINLAENTAVNALRAERLVSRADREQRDNQRGRVIWLTGQEEARLELAGRLEKELFDLRKRVYYLDRGFLAAGLSSDIAPLDLDEHARRTAEAAKLLVDNGLVAIVTPLGSGESESARLIIGKEDFVAVAIEDAAELNKKLAELVNLIISG